MCLKVESLSAILLKSSPYLGHLLGELSVPEPLSRKPPLTSESKHQKGAEAPLDLPLLFKTLKLLKDSVVSKVLSS